MPVNTSGHKILNLDHTKEYPGKTIFKTVQNNCFGHRNIKLTHREIKVLKRNFN